MGFELVIRWDGTAAGLAEHELSFATWGKAMGALADVARRLHGGAGRAGYRLMEEWISGRARFVGDGFVTLGAGVARADVVAAAEAVLEPLLEAVKRARRLAGGSAPPVPGARITAAMREIPEEAPWVEKVTSSRNAEALTAHGEGSTLNAMIPTQVLQSVSREVEQTAGSAGAMINLSVRVPKDYVQRVKATAQEHGMSVSEYLRTLGWLFSKD